MKYLNSFLTVILCAFIFHAGFGQTELRLNRIEGFSSSEKVSDLIFDNSDNLYITSNSGVFYYSSTGTSQPKKVIPQRNATSVVKSASGNVLATFQDNSVYSNEEFVYKIEKANTTIRDIELRGDEIWLATNNGIYVVNQRSKKLRNHYTTRNSNLVTNEVNFVYLDSSDIMWIGSQKGVIRVEKDKWSKCFEQDKDMLAITEYYDIVWLISDQEMWEIESADNRWYPAALKKGLFKGEINDIVIDNEGMIYIASDVLIRFNPEANRIEEYGKSLGLVSKKCLALACDPDNNIYIGTENAGLFKISTEVIEVEKLSALAILENPINCHGGMDGSILLEVFGGQAPLEYTWDPPNLKGTNPKNLRKGNYTVTVTDAFGTEIIKNILIEEPNPIDINVVSKERITGPGRKDGKCTIEVTGGSYPYDIRWDNKEKGLSAKKLNFGIHIIDVTDANGCTNSATIEIEREKFIPELDIAKIRIGQTLRINKLYFKSDQSEIDDKSNDVLLEILDFMSNNPGVVIEIGGHTNNIPTDEYCDKLSSERASKVADFMLQRGIGQDRVKHVGYGKRKPIASNETPAGRNRNQRVEIKILKLEE